MFCAGIAIIGCTDASPQSPDLLVSTGGGCDGSNCPCASDADCHGATPRCDRNTQACVTCLPMADNCALGTHCIPSGAGFACSATCEKASDCAALAGGGVAQCCSSACSDPSSDPFNCGGCGHSCPLVPNAAAGCHAARCGVGTCNAGYADCNKMDQDGCEVNILVDAKNCGACGGACPAYTNGSDPCVAGVCAPACNANFLDCNMVPIDGCEVSALTDVKNCGRCGLACPVAANGSVVCTAGSCAIGACNSGYRDCNKVIADGCEANSLTDPRNCGACGVICNLANTVPVCANGLCVASMCSPGYADCDGLPANGCEINLASDLANCGGCGRACRPPNGTAACSNAQCQIAACNAGFADCDMNVVNGCEDPIATDVMNCGGCGKACPMVANGVAGCKNGGCGVGSCSFGYADCNNDPSDGCEASLLSVKTCGACNIVCPSPVNASPGCNAGACGIGMCNPLWGDCNKNGNDGCERSLAVDITNCGACGKVCAFANAVPLCLGGVCGMSACNAGYGDCDKNAANGCETNTNSDVNNCGGCGVVCPNNAPFCTSGVCGASTHNLQTLAWDYDATFFPNTDSSSWWSQNFGTMTYQACEALANKYGAQYMGETGYFQGGNYALCPYQGFVRWVGEADANNAFISTNNWSLVNTAAKGNQNYCVLAYANASTPGGATFNTTAVSLNGQTYHYNDYGTISEATCYSNARLAGARPLNPWMLQGLNNPTRAHMVENHQDHGSCEYTGLGAYGSDGNFYHTYRCIVGYTQ